VAHSSQKRGVLKSWLENLQFSFSPPCLNLRDDLRIRAVLEKELEELRVSGLGYFYGITNTSSCVIETSVGLEKARTKAAFPWDVREEQRSVFDALLLYRDRLIKLQDIRIEDEEYVSVDEDKEYVSQYEAPLWTSYVATHHGHPFELRSEDRDEFNSYWQKVNRSRKRAPHLEASIGRFSLASIMAGDNTRWAHRFVDYVSSMEALLTEESGELSFKLAMGMAALLGRSPEESQNVFDFMREAYAVRSKLVHGADLVNIVPLKVRQAEVGFEEGLGRLHSYCRSCIRFVADLAEGGFEDKKQLARLLGLTQLRSDLRESMISFLDGKEAGKKLKDDFDKAANTPFHRTLHEERQGVLP